MPSIASAAERANGGIELPDDVTIRGLNKYDCESLSGSHLVLIV